MNKDQQPHFFTQIDVSSTPRPPKEGGESNDNGEVCSLLRHMLAAQDRQNELLEELVEQFSMAQRQRSNELAQWKKANPDLAYFCKQAADQLSRVQTDYLNTIIDEIHENYDNMMDGEFILNEFIDRFGPRFAHLNGILQVLAQLGNAPDQIPTPRRVK
jgi:hypothetical protein